MVDKREPALALLLLSHMLVGAMPAQEQTPVLLLLFDNVGFSHEIETDARISVFFVGRLLCPVIRGLTQVLLDLH